MLRRTGFFALDLARIQPLPSAAPTREEPRNAVCIGHDMCTMFSLSRLTENLSPRRRTEEEGTRTRIALLTVHNPSSIFLCP